jgi:hypothetical protein
MPAISFWLAPFDCEADLTMFIKIFNPTLTTAAIIARDGVLTLIILYVDQM